LIIAGLIQIYLAIKLNYNKQQALLNLEESERFAQYILNQRIRQAGLIICQNQSQPVQTDQAITGYNSQNLPVFLQGQVIVGTDALVIKSCENNSHISQDTQFTTMAYYIGDTNRKNQQGQSILGLFQKPEEGDRVELISGIEQMQILYGVSKNPASELLVYLPAEQVTDWLSVRSVQIDLLLNSIDAVLNKPQTYFFQGQTVMPQDLLLYKSISSYIKLRER